MLTHIIQTDPANFSRPLEYLPERWLKSADPSMVFNKAAFFPLCITLTKFYIFASY